MKKSEKINYTRGGKVGMCFFVKEVAPHIYPNGEKRRKAVFQCECGDEFQTQISNVKNGHTQSCGCLRKKSGSEAAHYRHGLTGDRIYKAWSHAKDRCYKINDPAYKDYGGRGIEMYEFWINDPEAFVIYCRTLSGWDDLNLSVDRINNNGNYEPGNLRFVDQHIQSINQRKRKNNTSGFTGIYQHIGNKYSFAIVVNRVCKSKYPFKTALQAAEARDIYIIKTGLWEYPLQVIRSL